MPFNTSLLFIVFPCKILQAALFKILQAALIKYSYDTFRLLTQKLTPNLY